MSLLDELDDLPPGGLGEVRAAGVDRRDRRAARRRQPERLGHAGHRRRGPHRHAMPVRARHRVLDLGEVLLADPARAQLLVVVPAVRARAELLPAPAAVEHRPAGDDDRRDVRRARAQDRRRVRLVAAGEQDDAVEGIGADRLLDVHRHQVAIEHRRRLHQRLAERHDRELAREAAGLQDAALDRLGQAAQVHVAVDELRPRVADADHGSSAERLVADAAGLQPGAVQESVEVLAVEPLRAPAPVGALVAAVAHRGHVAPSYSRCVLEHDLRDDPAPVVHQRHRLLEVGSSGSDASRSGRGRGRARRPARRRATRSTPGRRCCRSGSGPAHEQVGGEGQRPSLARRSRAARPGRPGRQSCGRERDRERVRPRSRRRGRARPAAGVPSPARTTSVAPSCCASSSSSSRTP